MSSREKAELLFGPAGTPHSAKSPSTEAGIERVAELGLGCMEVQFVRGVKMRREMAAMLGQLAQKRGVKLTAHAPYAVNLNAEEREKVVASQERILDTARVASFLGAEGIVFHAAFYLGDDPATVYARVKGLLEQMVSRLRAEGNEVLLRPEIMGKGSQFGSLEEVLNLSAEVRGVAPCIDFAHWHARTGKANSYDEFLALLDQTEGKLGRGALDGIHIHLSGIEYGGHGETRHLNLEDSDFRYVELLRALKDREAKGLIICESPNLEEDALLLQQTYLSL